VTAYVDNHVTSPSIARWALLLGGIGFAAGFFGPMVLAPDANQGPMLGIFLTGPGGALAGALLGVGVRILRLPSTLQRRVLYWVCGAYGVVILLFLARA